MSQYHSGQSLGPAHPPQHALTYRHPHFAFDGCQQEHFAAGLIAHLASS